MPTPNVLHVRFSQKDLQHSITIPNFHKHFISLRLFFPWSKIICISPPSKLTPAVFSTVLESSCVHLVTCMYVLVLKSSLTITTGLGHHSSVLQSDTIDFCEYFSKVEFGSYLALGALSTQVPVYCMETSSEQIQQVYYRVTNKKSYWSIRNSGFHLNSGFGFWLFLEGSNSTGHFFPLAFLYPFFSVLIRCIKCSC